MRRWGFIESIVRLANELYLGAVKKESSFATATERLILIIIENWKELEIEPWQ